MTLIENLLSVKSEIILVILIVQLLTILSAVILFNKNRQLKRDIRLISDELGILLTCSRGISERLQQHQQQFKLVQHRQDRLEVPSNGDLIYDHAASLISKGMTEDEMISSCELSRGEINMITHLQKARQDNNTL